MPKLPSYRNQSIMATLAFIELSEFKWKDWLIRSNLLHFISENWRWALTALQHFVSGTTKWEIKFCKVKIKLFSSFCMCCLVPLYMSFLGSEVTELGAIAPPSRKDFFLKECKNSIAFYLPHYKFLPCDRKMLLRIYFITCP